MTVDLDQAVFFIYPDANALRKEYENQQENKISSKEEFVDAKMKLLWTRIQEIYRKFASEYFWHDEGIHWEFMAKTASPFDAFLHGKIRFGDGMEDEWFLTKLLMELTVADASLVATVFDTDGDFILIEAADVIPEWLEPENSKNRVFIHKGGIKIIPIDVFKTEPTLKEALKFIRSAQSKVAFDEKVTRVIKAKVSEEQKLHRTKVRVPLRVVQILNSKKQLIGPAISSFYNRQPEDMRIFTQMPRFNPGKTGGPLVLTTVPMTRIQFAQLACQEFVAPSNDSVNFDIQNCENAVAAELGMKLTCGFEILMNTTEPKFVYKNLFETQPICIRQEIENILIEDNPNFSLNEEPEDNLDWMQIDEEVLDSDLQTKLNQLSMNETEENELIDTWTKEFEDGSEKLKGELSEIDQIVEKMKKMIESKSNFEGIEDLKSCEDSDGYDSETDSDSEEYDEDFIEREIFETINYDPDLLMKILEANANMGVSSEEFLARFTKYQQENPIKEGEEGEEEEGNLNKQKQKQKGLADIDTEKLEEARKSSRKQYESNDVNSEVIDNEASDNELNDNDNVNDNVNNVNDIGDSDASDVDDEFIYGQTLEQLKRSIKTTTELLDDEEEFDEKENMPLDEMNVYYAQMENELQSTLQSSYDANLDAETNLGKNLIESLAAGRGMTAATVNPIETVVSGLGERVPRPSK